MSLRMINDVLASRDIKTHCPLCGRKFGRVEPSEEHIFPTWLQHHHDLWTRRLTIPNFIGKHYKSVKIDICTICNGTQYGGVETLLSKLFRSSDPYEILATVPNEDLAIWLGKISWLLCRKSHSIEDFRTRDEPEKDRILPREMMPGILYLGMVQRTFATKKGMFSCYSNDPPYPELYGDPYSLYRFRIDTQDTRFEAFDFTDNFAVLGVAIRSNNVGLVCVFDGGLHRTFRSHHYEFLVNESLHPNQFNEVIGRIFFDQTVLNEHACKVTYFWNKPLHSVIAMTQTPRSYDPYLQENYDPKRFALMVGRQMGIDPGKMIFENGTRVFTSLKDHNGAFLRFAVTDADIESARSNPNQEVIGPLDAQLRQKPPTE